MTRDSRRRCGWCRLPLIGNGPHEDVCTCDVIGKMRICPICACRHRSGNALCGGTVCLFPPQAKATTPAAVDHPSHYTAGEIECIDAIKASMSAEAFGGFLKGNAIKYLWRMHHKGKPQEDAQKAKWYLSRLQKEIDGEI